MSEDSNWRECPKCGSKNIENQDSDICPDWSSWNCLDCGHYWEEHEWDEIEED